MRAKSKLKRWVNSYGVIVPKEIVEKEGLVEGETVEITVREAAEVEHLFGRYPFKDLQSQKDAMRKGWRWCRPDSFMTATRFFRSLVAIRPTRITSR